MNLQMNSDCVDFNLHYNGGKYFTIPYSLVFDQFSEDVILQ